MRVVWVFRYALAIAIAVYALDLLLGSVGLIDDSLALLIGILAAWTMPIAALLCVISQMTVLVLNKRRVTHG